MAHQETERQVLIDGNVGHSFLAAHSERGLVSIRFTEEHMLEALVEGHRTTCVLHCHFDNGHGGAFVYFDIHIHFNHIHPMVQAVNTTIKALQFDNHNIDKSQKDQCIARISDSCLFGLLVAIRYLLATFSGAQLLPKYGGRTVYDDSNNEVHNSDRTRQHELGPTCVCVQQSPDQGRSNAHNTQSDNQHGGTDCYRVNTSVNLTAKLYENWHCKGAATSQRRANLKQLNRMLPNQHEI